MKLLREFIQKVRYKISRYIPYIKAFGFIRGIRIKRQVYHKTRGKIDLPEYTFPIYLRPNSIDRYTFKEIFLFREYDVPIDEIINENSFIIDCGANIGYTSLFFNHKFSKPTIIAIEPEKSNFEILQQNTSGYENIDIKFGAIWHEKGKVSIRDRGLGSRSISVEPAGDTNKSTVDTFTIPELLGAYERDVIDLLKMDIEGSEKKLFEHELVNNKWLRNVKCMIVEPHDRYVPGCKRVLLQAARQYGFLCKKIGENYLCLNKNFDSCKKILDDVKPL